MPMAASQDLFNLPGGVAPNAPLAERLRPKTLDEVAGQVHLLGSGKPLRVAFESGRPHSMIFWGPPGVGKTTLARLMAAGFDAQFLAMSAVLGGVKDIREAVVMAQVAQGQGRRTILFVDEVHRFNKAQQDAFLPYVESGLFTFIGATTENPSFEVNSALLSRARVYVLESLGVADLQELLRRAMAMINAALPESETLQFDEPAQAQLAAWADGDARRLINAVEVVAESARGAARRVIDSEWLETSLSQNLRRFDKGGDAFYDQISALHKSVRGSDPDASLYWFARMLDGGADPRYLSRRIVRMAVEDIGLADPRATEIALNGADIYERLGSPEGELALAQAVVYLACAAKSNALYGAYKAARAYAQENGSAPVPLHLRNAPTKLMKQLGHGQAYRYAHDEPHGYSAGERYFPDGLKAKFYRPTDRGLEGKIAEKLAFLRKLDDEAKKKD
ncbi:MAG: replication-associated recombination protein A [Candidimonas sp.]|nr:MAG: replication-associated recombination protein A [Candidimonas sp.]TAM27185.1 MAG: replication-associated recombination protein A [Candidimonas sp.]TAM74838.1 MAG: replication-associated recombination protein A [Candidimonas sp.]